MPDVNALARELLRFQDNYRILDKENDRLREIEKAAEEYCDAVQRGTANPHYVFALLARLSGAVQRNRKAKRRK